MVMGVARNTPKYIWRNELGINSMRYVVRESALRHMIDVVKMGAERWLKICLREEITGILNGNATRWGKKMEKVIKDMECEELMTIM